MKRTEREYAKAKKRGDLLQKEKEAGRSEMIKVTGARDKLDKLSRNMAEENKKLRVSPLTISTNRCQVSGQEG